MENRDLELGDVEMIQYSVKTLLNRLTDEKNRHTKISSPSIYMAPGVLRDVSPNSFKPRIVSIGPLHRDDKNLQAFEGQKLRCLNNLMSRTSVPKEEILESCMRKVYAAMAEIKTCYVWTKVYEEPQIAEMMVMDACFILDFSYHCSKDDKLYPENRLLPLSIVFDLVLLENQIPLFILDQIYQCTVLKDRVPLIKYIFPILRYLNLFNKKAIQIPNSSTKTIPHILGLLHECYKPSSDIKPVYTSSKMHSTMHLDKAGVSFKPNNDPTWSLEIKVKLIEFPCCFGFWNMPTLTIPVLYVHGYTEVVLRNLIAYEQSRQTIYYVTSYANVMDELVNTPEDVGKLVNSKVLINDMGSNEEAANMINNICRNVTILDFFYNEECEKLTAYCDAFWPKHIVKLKRTSLNSPWNICALFVGFTLFFSAIVQTIYTIKSGK